MYKFKISTCLYEQVVCSQIGDYNGAVTYNSRAPFGEGSGSIWMDDVACTGNELNLFDCTFTESHNCGHSEDVAVECNSKYLYFLHSTDFN